MTSPSRSVSVQNGQDKSLEKLDHLRRWVRRLLIAKGVLQECMIILAVIGAGSYLMKLTPETVLMYLVIIILWFGGSFVKKLHDGFSPSVQNLREFLVATKGVIRDGVLVFSAILLFVILARIASGAITPEDVLAVCAIGLIYLGLAYVAVAALLYLSKYEELKTIEKMQERS